MLVRRTEKEFIREGESKNEYEREREKYEGERENRDRDSMNKRDGTENL